MCILRKKSAGKAFVAGMEGFSVSESEVYKFCQQRARLTGSGPTGLLLDPSLARHGARSPQDMALCCPHTHRPTCSVFFQ